MAAASSDDLKQMIQEAVQTAVSQNLAEPKPKAQSKSKGIKAELDTTRTMGVQSQDPRADPDFWPCLGKHHPKTFSNRYGAWTECQKCALRLAYTPVKGQSGQHTHMDLPSNVTRAMEHLRMEGFTEKDLDSKLVKDTIKFIASQEQIKHKKSVKIKQPKSKAIPTDGVHTPVPEVHSLASEDEDFEKVGQKQKLNSNP